jgi:hypothetical protein
LCREAFMSTTTDKDVAMEYAAGSGRAGVVFEIQSSCRRDLTSERADYSYPSLVHAAIWQWACSTVAQTCPG